MTDNQAKQIGMDASIRMIVLSVWGDRLEQAEDLGEEINNTLKKLALMKSPFFPQIERALFQIETRYEEQAENDAYNRYLYELLSP